MKCIAPIDDTDISKNCGRDTIKEQKWCNIHIDKAVRSYKAYKGLEESLNLGELDIKVMDIYQLMSLYSKINKVLELRMIHMKSSISSSYYDKGHVDWRNMLSRVIRDVELELTVRFIYSTKNDTRDKARHIYNSHRTASKMNNKNQRVEPEAKKRYHYTTKFNRKMICSDISKDIRNKLDILRSSIKVQMT